MDVVSPRRRPPPRLPLERGRTRRHLRRPAVPLLRAGLLERRRSHLKERLFGLTGPEGNHGEDVKEIYFYADATPSHSYLKFVYHYPQAPFPYEDLVETNARRTRRDWEYELWDTGVLAENRCWIVTVEYSKASIDDIYIKITAENRGPDEATLHVLPQLYLRNRWSWGSPPDPLPTIQKLSDSAISATESHLGTYALTCDSPDALLFTENETGRKDAFHRYLIGCEAHAVSAETCGTKAAFVKRLAAGPGESATLHLRLRCVQAASDTDPDADDNPRPLRRSAPEAAVVRAAEEALDLPFAEAVRTQRIAEADAFYAELAPAGTTDDARRVQREAFAGLIWTKQFYHFDASKQLNEARNTSWKTLHAADILSMPDTWEYPWFAAWDLAFHTIPFALIDADFAKHQLLTLCREWYMHPSGQLPAYEWAFSDVNPPVHAWAALRIYKIERKNLGKKRGEPGDTDFLERIFHKLLINFTWWVNRKDDQGNNVFEGGFLGLDNIGVFDRSAPLPGGSSLEQCDGTAWMAMFSLNMLAIALELARTDSAYEDVATKFAEHFCYISHALNGMGLWDDSDGFYYDVLNRAGQDILPLKVRSIVGLIPLFAVEVFDADTLDAVPNFTARLSWFLRHKPEMTDSVAHLGDMGANNRAIFALVGQQRLRRILERVLDPDEFLSEHGIRSLSKVHAAHPYIFPLDPSLTVEYAPAESVTSLFGGNSNWRGPIWMPINYLFIESLQKYDFAYGKTFQIGGTDLWGVSKNLSDDRKAPDRPVSARRSREAPVFRRHRLSARPGSRSVQRILPRRQRRGPRREPSDRLDRPHRQADRADRIGSAQLERFFCHSFMMAAASASASWRT